MVRSLLLVWIGLAVATAGPAEAENKRRRSRKVRVQKMTPGGPALKYEQFRRKVAIKVAQKREEQIEGIQRLLDLEPDRSEVPDLKFRLAELYYEKSRFFFFRGQESDDWVARARSESERADALAEKKRSLREVAAWQQAATDIYREIHDQYPKYQRMPEVLFALGQAYWNDGGFKEAVGVYRELIVGFRDSPLVAEAWIAFGEFYFGEGDVNRALASYKKAAKDKRSRVYGFALYKQAWCYYNLSQWQEALRKFKATVLYSQLAEELSGENKIALGREAMKDFVRAYSHVGDAEGARVQLADLVGEEACRGSQCRSLLEQLAQLWFDDGYFRDAASLYRQLIQLDTHNSRNAFFAARIVDLTSRAGDKKRVIAESRRLIEVYRATKERIKNAPSDTAARDLEEAEVLAETTIRRLAQVWNREAMKTRNSRTYGYARTMYEDYLRLFPETKYVYEMRFQLGDLYFKLEKFNEAARMYEQTVLADPAGKYLEPAANDNILAVEEDIRDQGLRKPRQIDARQTIPRPKKRLIAACDRYVNIVPDAKAVVKGVNKKVAIRLKAAKTYYDYGHNDAALGRFEEIVEKHPGSSQAEVAANLVIDIYNQREDWKALYARSVAYRGMRALTWERAPLAAELAKYAEYAKFKLVQILESRVQEEGGDLRLVADAYEEFYEEFPGSDNADKALFNASVARDRAGQKQRANALRKRLLAEHPDSPLRADVAFYTAKRYEEQTQFEDAAAAFLDFAKKHPGDERARDALYNAAVFYAGTGRVRTANRLRLEYLRKHGRSKRGRKEAADIYWSIATDLERARRYRDAANRFRDYAREFGRSERFWDALWREAEIREQKLGDRSRAAQLKRDILGTYKADQRKGRNAPENAKRYASLVAFELLEPQWDQYRKLKIKTPNLKNPRPFERSLVVKARARDRLIGAYTEVVGGFKQAESTIAALYMIARAWEEFAERLARIPCPRGVSEDVCGLMKQGIESTLSPARDSALQAYKTCVAKSNELNAFTRYSTLCVKVLEKLAPETYPKIVERRLALDEKTRLTQLRSNDLILDNAGYAVSSRTRSAGRDADRSPTLRPVGYGDERAVRSVSASQRTDLE